MGIYFSAVIQGILWGIMGLGLFISFRMLRFADLTSEASFVVGAAVSVSMMTSGSHPLFAIVLGMLAGMLTGLFTGFLMAYLEIPSLLSGIITLTALYSINLRIMGRANLSLRQHNTVYDLFATWFPSDHMQRLVLGILVVTVCIVTLNYFFKTDLGQAIIATGDNEVMAVSLGISIGKMKCLALMLSNGLIALSGSLLAQYNKFADVSMGLGTVIIALSAIIIGELVFHQQLSLTMRLSSIIIGSIIYRLLLVFVLQLGFNPSDFRLVSASLLALLLAFPILKRKLANHLKGGI